MNAVPNTMWPSAMRTAATPPTIKMACSTDLMGLKPCLRLRLVQEFGNDRCGFAGAGDKKQMAVVDGHQPRVRNEACQDAAVGDWHDRIVGPCHDQRRLRQEAKPRQAAPAEARGELQVIAVVA